MLVIAALALVGFLMVAVVLPQKAGADSKEAAQALVAGADPAKQPVAAAAEKAGNLAGSGKDVKIAAEERPEIRRDEVDRRGRTARSAAGTRRTRSRSLLRPRLPAAR